MPRARTLVPVIAVALSGAALLASPARAGTASLSGGFGSINYSDAGNENNSLTVTGTGGFITFNEFGAASVSAGSGCAPVNPPKGAQCAYSNFDSIGLSLGGGDDNVGANVTLPVLALAGPGNDTVMLGSGDDSYAGDDGNDIVHAGDGDDTMADTFFNGGSGNDQMFGDAGNDTFLAGSRANDGAGADLMDGGTGVDTVIYQNRTADLSVTVDGGADDGEAGEGDDVRNMEIVKTAGGNDLISDVGPGLNNTFYGMGGDDTLRGGNGNDILFGGDDRGMTRSGNDILSGGAGADLMFGGDGTDTADYSDRIVPVNVSLDNVNNDGAAGEGDGVYDDVETVVGGFVNDQLSGSDGADTLRGGPGGDSLDGGGGADTLAGEDGDDVIAARDGAPDAVTCGAGNDMVSADPQDSVASDCELVDRGPTGGGGGGGGGTGGGDAPVLVLVTDAKQKLSKGVVVHVACTADCSLALSVMLDAKTAKKLKLARTIISGKRSLKAAQQATVKLKPSRKTAAKLRALRRFKVKLSGTASDAGGHARAVTRTVTISR